MTALQFASGVKHIEPKQLADVLQALSLRQDNVLAVIARANEHRWVKRIAQKVGGGKVMQDRDVLLDFIQTLLSYEAQLRKRAMRAFLTPVE